MIVYIGSHVFKFMQMYSFIVFLRIFSWLSIPVQSTAWKDSSPNKPVTRVEWDSLVHILTCSLKMTSRIIRVLSEKRHSAFELCDLLSLRCSLDRTDEQTKIAVKRYLTLQFSWTTCVQNGRDAECGQHHLRTSIRNDFKICG